MVGILQQRGKDNPHRGGPENLNNLCGQLVMARWPLVEDSQKPPSVRVTAARIIPETAVKACEMEDLTTRIENLELKIQKR